MPIEDDDARRAFLNTDEDGETATYTLAIGGASSVDGLYDGPHDGAEFGAGVTVSSTAPAFTCLSSDLPAGAAQDDTIIVAAGTFIVKELQPDGFGFTRLDLTK